MAESEQQTVRTVCQECNHQTKHNVVASFGHEGYAEGPDIYWWEVARILQCAGCETISFTRECWDSESGVDRDGEPNSSIYRYPEAPAASRAPMAGADWLPDSVGRLYGETLLAMGVGAVLLASAGLRATIEAACVERNVATGNLNKKIDQLVQLEYLGREQAEFLHMQRYLGNDALHDADPPTMKELEHCLDIVEAVLGTLFVLPVKAAEVERIRLRRGAKSLSSVNRQAPQQASQP